MAFFFMTFVKYTLGADAEVYHFIVFNSGLTEIIVILGYANH